MRPRSKCCGGRQFRAGHPCRTCGNGAWSNLSLSGAAAGQLDPDNTARRDGCHGPNYPPVSVQATVTPFLPDDHSSTALVAVRRLPRRLGPVPTARGRNCPLAVHEVCESHTSGARDHTAGQRSRFPANCYRHRASGRKSRDRVAKCRGRQLGRQEQPRAFSDASRARTPTAGFGRTTRSRSSMPRAPARNSLVTDSHAWCAVLAQRFRRPLDCGTFVSTPGTELEPSSSFWPQSAAVESVKRVLSNRWSTLLMSSGTIFAKCPMSRSGILDISTSWGRWAVVCCRLGRPIRSATVRNHLPL